MYAVEVHYQQEGQKCVPCDMKHKQQLLEFSHMATDYDKFIWSEKHMKQLTIYCPFESNPKTWHLLNCIHLNMSLFIYFTAIIAAAFLYVTLVTCSWVPLG